jgi:hypothetical protein
MSDFTALRAVALTLRDLLTVAITASTDPELAGIQVYLHSPSEMRDNKVPAGVSLWMHRVWRTADLNIPETGASPQYRLHPGVPLEVGFLATPVHSDAEVRHTLLGRVIQVFNDNATVRGPLLRDSLAGTDAQLRLLMHTDLLPDLSSLWQALDLPYQLCVPYLVQRVVIDSERPPMLTPLVTRRESAADLVVAVTEPT